MAVRLEALVKREGPLSENQLKALQKWLDEDWEANDIDRNMIKLTRRLLATIEEVRRG